MPGDYCRSDTRPGHSLPEQTSRVQSLSQNIWSRGETAVSPEQIGTDRINVNENFMIAHHAIFMSRPMSALASPGHKWGRWWWRCHPDTDTRTHPVIIIRHKLSQLSLQSGRPAVSCSCHWTQFYQRVTTVKFRLQVILTSVLLVLIGSFGEQY